ncbi:MAG: hypothetical protein NTV73_10270 [Hyphomicrobiales bacterium]|nr:hypothetical protein [Hyphomicrobiales bacterium]
MRAFFLLLVIGGIGASFVYPWAITSFSGHEIGTWRVYESGGAFSPVVTKLAAADAPVRVLVDMIAVAPPEFAQSSTVLTVTAATGGRTVLAEPVSFFEAKPQEKSPQLREKAYRDEAGVISEIADGDYSFVVGQGDAEDIRIKSVDLVLRGGAATVDARAQPLGYAATAIGFIGLVLAMRRGRRERNPNSQPPPPRWGRGGDQPPA